MEHKQPSQMDLLIESHLGLKRQGPGSTEMTLKALSFVELPKENAHIADMGCGIGGQTMLLAQNTVGSITGVDFIADFIEVFNDNAQKLSLHDRVQGIVGSIDALAFEKDSLDLIWSEGVIDSLGFGKTCRKILGTVWHLHNTLVLSTCLDL